MILQWLRWQWRALFTKRPMWQSGWWRNVYPDWRRSRYTDKRTAKDYASMYGGTIERAPLSDMVWPPCR